MKFYLLEDDDKIKSITLYILYPQLMHIKHFVLYITIYLLNTYQIINSFHVCINSKNNSDVGYIYNSNYEDIQLKIKSGYRYKKVFE